MCKASQGQSITKLELVHTPTAQQRHIWHLQYSDWADHGCPKDVGQFLSNCTNLLPEFTQSLIIIELIVAGFLEEVDTVRRHSVAEVLIEKKKKKILI